MGYDKFFIQESSIYLHISPCMYFCCLLVLNAKRVFGAIVVSKSRGNQVNVQIMEIQSKLKHNTCDSLLLYPNLKSLNCHIVW